MTAAAVLAAAEPSSDASGEEAWRRRFARFAGLAGATFWETDASQVIVAAHGEDPRLAAALVGRPLLDLIGGDVLPGLGLARAAVEAGRPFADCEIEAVIAGAARTLRIDARPLRRGDPSAGFCGLAADVTEAASVLRAEDRLRRGLIDALNAFDGGVALFDAEDRLLVSNANYFRGLYGADAIVETGLTFRTLVQIAAASGCVVDAAGREAAWIAERMAFHRAPRGAFPLSMADGRSFLVRETRTADGFTLVIHGEVTEQVRITEALARRTMLLQETLAAIGEGVMALDADGKVELVNETFSALVGCDVAEDRAGCQGLAEIGPRIAPNPDDAAARGFTPQRLMQAAGAYAATMSDGRTLEIRHAPRADGGALVTARDVSERMRQELALRAALREAEFANRAKTNFIATMSHELRTPLNAIIGFAEIIKNETFGPLGEPRYRAYAEDVHASGLHLLEVVNDVLDLARIESGRFELTEKQIDVERLLRGVVRIMHERAQRGQIDLVVDPPPAVALRGDERALKQILLNLVANSVRHTPAKGRIALAVEPQPDGGVALAVADTGIGMDGAAVNRALNRFSQLGEVLVRSNQGAGLGLPLCKALAELHGGRLEIVSEPGRGAVARVVLPADRTGPPRAVPNDPGI